MILISLTGSVVFGIVLGVLFHYIGYGAYLDLQSRKLDRRIKILDDRTTSLLESYDRDTVEIEPELCRAYLPDSFDGQDIDSLVKLREIVEDLECEAREELDNFDYRNPVLASHLRKFHEHHIPYFVNKLKAEKSLPPPRSNHG